MLHASVIQDMKRRLSLISDTESGSNLGSEIDRSKNSTPQRSVTERPY